MAKSTYYAESQKKYNNKVKLYAVKFSLSDDDKSIVAFMENEMQEKGLTANAYIKGILKDYVNAKYRD